MQKITPFLRFEKDAGKVVTIHANNAEDEKNLDSGSEKSIKFLNFNRHSRVGGNLIR